MNHLSIQALDEFPIINPGDNLCSIIIDSIKGNEILIDDGDVILLAQKIVSKSENRFKNLSKINPSEKALKLGKRLGRDPAFIQLILDESNEILSTEKNVIIVEHKLGYININAGIDRSNISKNNDLVLLLPENPKKSANDLQTQINTQIGKDISVIITDSMTRPYRSRSIWPSHRISDYYTNIFTYLCIYLGLKIICTFFWILWQQKYKIVIF